MCSSAKWPIESIRPPAIHPRSSQLSKTTGHSPDLSTDRQLGVPALRGIPKRRCPDRDIFSWIVYEFGFCDGLVGTAVTAATAVASATTRTSSAAIAATGTGTSATTVARTYTAAAIANAAAT